MKSNLFIFAWVLAALFSCTDDTIPGNTDDTITVPIKLGGEYVNISYGSMTRAGGGNSYYAFEVDSVYKLQISRNVDTTIYCRYAEGIFTDAKNLSIQLKKGSKYRIRCGIVEDGVDKLEVDGNGCIHGIFHGSWDDNMLGNMFVYSDANTINNLNSIDAVNTSDGYFVTHPQMNRYYGETTTEGGSITIPMERYNSGLHLIINPPVEGELCVSNGTKYDTEKTCSNPYFDYTLTPSSEMVNESNTYLIGITGNDFLNLCPKIIWKRADGTSVDLSPEKFKVPRNTIATIKIDVNDRVGGSDISFVKESTMVQGDTIIIK